MSVFIGVLVYAFCYLRLGAGNVLDNLDQLFILLGEDCSGVKDDAVILDPGDNRRLGLAQFFDPERWVSTWN